MANKAIPFHTKSAVLETIIHSDNPQSQPTIVDVVVDTLKSDRELRAYFFRNQPHPAWIPILWENGFFDNPPLPEQTAEGLRFPFWDAQEFLISVAPQVPEYFLRHINILGKQSVYASRAINGLTHLSDSDIESAMPRVTELLSDYTTSQSIDYVVWDVLYLLADKQLESAFTLFDALLRPFPNPHAKEAEGYTYNTEARGAFSFWHLTRDETKEVFETLKALNSEKLAQGIEGNLRYALRLEEDAGSTVVEYAWWRQAIEFSDQNDYHHYKDYVLDLLRDAAEAWMQKDNTSAKLQIERYLADPSVIFRRLGMHLLRIGSTTLPDLTVRELLNEKNYNDSAMNHEFLLLLQDGYINLDETNRQKVVDIVLQGPPKDVLELRAEQWAESRGISKEEYIEIRVNDWLRTRLWMIKDNLPERATAQLQRLVRELGKPEHPTFLNWHGQAGFVSQESPLPSEQLSQYTPEELAAFMKQWQPDSQRWSGLQEVSYEGLGQTVANIILADIERYKTVLLEAFSAHPDYAHAFISKATESAKKEALTEANWTILIGLCEDLLYMESIRNDMKREWQSGWRDVRKRIVELLRVALYTPNSQNTVNLRSRVRDLLLLLLNDPDPAHSDDQPQEGWVGYKDPFTVSINHVRSDALILLIEYALLRAEEQRDKQANSEPVSECLEPIVQRALTEELLDESSAVHSVYGRFLMALHWLDRGWVEEHLDTIFPSGQTEEEIWAYVSAWDSYVIANQKLDLDLMDRLHPYYEQAIENLRRGHVTQTHLRPVEGLASHLVFAYFTQVNNGKIKPSETLLYRFYEVLNPEDRAKAALAVLNRCANYHKNTEPMENWWTIACALWQDRVHVAASQNNAPEFYKEMIWYAQLLDFAPAHETIASMWGLLQGTLPYIYAENYDFRAWSSFEKFIHRQIGADPRRSIELYTQMHERSTQTKWFTRNQDEQTRKILEAAASRPEARQQTLALIDYLARKGDQRFSDIYERWSLS